MKVGVLKQTSITGFRSIRRHISTVIKYPDTIAK
jgi:hypothetical protein